MEERTLHVLEFDRFLQVLKTHTLSELGRALCLQLRPADREGTVRQLLQEVSEANLVMVEEGDLPLGEVRDVRPLLQESRAEGACLIPESLLALKSTLEAARRVKQFLTRHYARAPILASWVEKIPTFEDLCEDLKRTIGPRGEVLDSASPELKRIRREVFRVRGRIRKDLESLWGREDFARIFQEQIITLRNDRYVVAVKAEFKNTLPGIIHDQSQSRATYFIEPFSTVEENNELNLLLKDEKEEERRILLSLTAEVREEADEIAHAVETVARLDLVFAKSKWARANHAAIPALNTRGFWNLKNARHPLLDARRAVPIDLRLDADHSALIISGANAGGKTAALKTLGLLTLAVQAGIPVPASADSEVAIFGKIFADIGDEQSLEDDLSTFSAWILSTTRILKEADHSSLVLLDEVGGGTDPGEGAALTMALLDGLRERGAKTVVTTHLNMLKAYGALHADVMNVSVEFNSDTLRPTFRLIYGRPGESYALLMAERLGIPRELVEKALNYMGEGDRQERALLQKLERTQQELEGEREAARRLKEQAEKVRKTAEEILLHARKERETLVGQAREEGHAVVRQAKEELRTMIREFKERGRTDLHTISGKIKEEEERLARWAAEVSEESPGGAAEEAKPSSAPESFIPFPEWKKAGSPRRDRKEERTAASKAPLVHYEIPAAGREIKIIGLRVDEALPMVDKALDEAFLAGLKELEIIHGSGTGRLRGAVREYLAEHPLVKTFFPGGPGRGGDGVTIVEIGAAPAPGNGQKRPKKRRAEA